MEITDYTYSQIMIKYNLIYTMSYEEQDLFVSIMNGNFDENIDPDTITDLKIITFIGLYYQYVNRDYVKMKKYYNIGIDKDNDESMFWMGCYYYDMEKNDEMIKKYLNMATVKGHIKACYLLAYYYEDKEKNYEMAKAYYHNGDNMLHKPVSVYY